jgi:hypothetical protein
MVMYFPRKGHRPNRIPPRLHHVVLTKSLSDRALRALVWGRELASPSLGGPELRLSPSLGGLFKCWNNQWPTLIWGVGVRYMGEIGIQHCKIGIHDCQSFNGQSVPVFKSPAIDSSQGGLFITT